MALPMKTTADYAIATNGPAFIDACTKLAGMISPAKANILAAGINLYAALFADQSPEDPRSPLDVLPVAVMGPIVLAMLHVATGTPLFMSDELMALWMRCDGSVAECPHDGYRVPKGVESCPVCGGRNGEPGCWRDRRRVAAAWN
jgi:hypothetical protein